LEKKKIKREKVSRKADKINNKMITIMKANNKNSKANRDLNYLPIL